METFSNSTIFGKVCVRHSKNRLTFWRLGTRTPNIVNGTVALPAKPQLLEVKFALVSVLGAVRTQPRACRSWRQLPGRLKKVGEIYDRESQAQIKRLLTLEKPILILGLGGLIATIITSVLLAILNLNNLIV